MVVHAAVAILSLAAAYRAAVAGLQGKQGVYEFVI